MLELGKLQSGKLCKQTCHGKTKTRMMTQKRKGVTCSSLARRLPAQYRKAMPANAEAQQGSKVPEKDLEACLGPKPAHALLHVLPLQTCTAQLARCTASLPGLDSFHDCLNQHGKLVAAPVGSWLPRTAQLLEVGADMPTSISVSALRTLPESSVPRTSACPAQRQR